MSSRIAAIDAALDPRIARDRDVAASGLCTWRVGGPIALLVRPADTEELLALAHVLPDDVPTLVIGRGSNLLVADRGFDGVGIVLGRGFEALTGPGLDTAAPPGTTTLVTSGAAAALPVLARRTAAAGLTGLEFFVGIPGSVGGAVRMNAGGHGRTTADVLVDATVVDLRAATVTVRRSVELDFTYRHSAIGPRDVVVGATWSAQHGAVDETTARIDEIVAWRREHQPGGANAGSVFTNPVDDSAGRLIEAAGLKGMRVGGAYVSDKHANFIQAEAGASAGDVAELIDTIAAAVAGATGVELHTEVQMVGFAGPHPRRTGSEMGS